MRIIITGGSGLIGRELTASLAADGHEVIVLSRSPERISSLPHSARAEKWDARTADGWGHLADGAGAIVNLAGENLAGSGFFPTRWTPERKRLIRESRLQSGQAIVQAVEAAASKPSLVIQSSAIGYYGVHGDETLTEEAAPGNDFLAKLAMEWEASTEPVESMGVRRAIIRTGIVLSMEGGALQRLLLPFKLFAGGPMGNGRQWYSWIHIKDVMHAIRFLIETPEVEGVFNLTAPNPLTNAALARVIGQVMKRPSFLPVPGFALRLMFGEVATVVLDGQRVLPNHLEALGFTFEFPEAKGALRDLLN